jgi:hypothetical protein
VEVEHNRQCVEDGSHGLWQPRIRRQSLSARPVIDHGPTPSSSERPSAIVWKVLAAATRRRIADLISCYSVISDLTPVVRRWEFQNLSARLSNRHPASLPWVLEVVTFVPALYRRIAIFRDLLDCVLLGVRA